MLKVFSKIKNTTIIKKKIILIQISPNRCSFLFHLISIFSFSNFLCHSYFIVLHAFWLTLDICLNIDNYKHKKPDMNLIKSDIDAFKWGIIFLWDQKNSTRKSGLAVKSGVVKSGKINILKTYKDLGPRHHGY